MSENWKDYHLGLWQSGWQSYEKRKERFPYDTVLVEVMDMLTTNLRKKIKGFTVDQLLEQYANSDFDFPKEIYGDKWQYYMDYEPDEYVGGNYVILSTFEDAAYYIIFQEIVEEVEW